MTRIAAIVAALALAGCGGKKDDKANPPAAGSGSGSAAAPAGSGSSAQAGSGSAAPAGSGSGSAAAQAGSGSAAPSAPAALPTEEDFEQQAKSEIDDKNVDSKLTAIEKELGQ
jgi:hypothetical protein